MHFAEIDRLSTCGNSLLHRAGVVAKLVLTALLLASFIATTDVYLLLGLLGLVLAFLLMGKIPLLEVGHLALYPAFFSLIFALVRAQQAWVMGLVVILKAVGAALTMLLLFTTTPYVDVFAVMAVVMPSLLVDIFFFTYRAFFMLVGRISSLFKSMRLRGGYRSFNVFTNLRNIAGIIGTVIVQAFEMSERMNRIYELRGYNGKIPLTESKRPQGLLDYSLIFAGMIILAGVIVL